MPQVPLRAVLRNRILLTAAAVLLFFPAVLSLWVLPRFTGVVAGLAEKESVLFAEHLAQTIALREFLAGGGEGLPPAAQDAVADLQRAFAVHRLALFRQDGVRTFADDPAQHVHPIPEDILAVLRQGRPASRLVRSEAGHGVASAVLETYAPLLSGTDLLGAVMVCQEVSTAALQLDILTRRIQMGAAALSFLLFALALAGARREARAQRALHDQLAFLQALLDALPLPVFYKNAQGLYLGCNAAYLRFHGLTREEVLGRRAQELLPPAQAAASEEADGRLRERPDEARNYEVRLPDGPKGQRVVVYSKAAFRDSAGNFAGIVGSIQDITARTHAEERLREARDRLEEIVAERTAELVRANAELSLMAKVFEHSLDGITITDAHGGILKVNPAFSHITGYSPEEVVGQNPRLLKSDRHDAAFYAAMWSALVRDGQWEGEIWNRRKDGEAYPEWLSISAIKDGLGTATHYVAVFHDITEIKRSEELMKHQAYHDALTGLPNRLLLRDRLGVAITHAKRSGHHLALLFLDMDNFKTVNDSLGHSVGDLLLMAFAHRLKNLLREQDTVARLGGDEFVVMVEEVADANAAVAVGERILEAMRQPFTIKGHELYVTASVGITLYPEDGATPEVLIKNADLAMYRAKEQGKNTSQLFTLAMNERVHARLTLERSLRKAVERGEFEVWYQPKVHLATWGIIGMEALVRWRREDGSLVSPGEFIPVAEETGIIGDIGDHVLETACLQAKAWHDMGWGHLALAVNLSMRQIGQKGLLEHIEAVLKRTDIDPSLLELEITETAIMSRVEQAVSTLEEIRRLGAHIAVDDFGTGYSSLYYLKRFPIRGIKVDRSFVRNLPQDADDLAIVRTVVAMSRGLGLHVTAEGVETMEQLETLRRLDCDFAQGYLFSPPVDAASFTRILEAGGGLLRPGGPSATSGRG